MSGAHAPTARLTMSRRIAFCASHQLGRSDRGEAANRAVWGEEGRGRHGHGHNYAAYFIFAGPLDPDTGILANLAHVKLRLAEVVDGRYDHRHLNADTPPFDVVVPTVENVAVQLLAEVGERYRGEAIAPVACHLEQSALDAATAYADGTVERHRWFEFSAARVTRSPHLSEEENRARFGIAARPAGHGHNYRARLTLAGVPDLGTGEIAAGRDVEEVVAGLCGELDHRNLSAEVPALAGLPTTTEVIARLIRDVAAARLPVARVRLYELPDFFAEVDGTVVRLGVTRRFFAAHRLHSQRLDARANLGLYGKCNNPAGHGHGYVAEATVAGHLDERSGTLCDLGELIGGLEGAIEPWAYRHLDAEVEEFRVIPTTGENIVTQLWRRVAPLVPARLVRLRLWETDNNRFTLRLPEGEG